MITLSIIIPCNESQEIVHTFLPGILSRIANTKTVEVILVDASDRPEIREYLQSFDCRYAYAPRASRSVQCNFGASVAKSEFLFFLHIDSLPPQGFDSFIIQAFRQKMESGCFRLRFDIESSFLSAFAWFTRFKWAIARGGDQGLYVSRNCFDDIGRFDENLQIMEDIDICRKLLRRGRFEVLNPVMITSARKYTRVGILKLQTLFTVMTAMYWLGFSNGKIFRFYKRYI